MFWATLIQRLIYVWSPNDNTIDKPRSPRISSTAYFEESNTALHKSRAYNLGKLLHIMVHTKVYYYKCFYLFFFIGCGQVFQKALLCVRLYLYSPSCCHTNVGLIWLMKMKWFRILILLVVLWYWIELLGFLGLTSSRGFLRFALYTRWSIPKCSLRMRGVLVQDLIVPKASKELISFPTGCGEW